MFAGRLSNPFGWYIIQKVSCGAREMKMRSGMFRIIFFMYDFSRSQWV